MSIEALELPTPLVRLKGYDLSVELSLDVGLKFYEDIQDIIFPS